MYRSLRVKDASDSIQLCEPWRPRGVPEDVSIQNPRSLIGGLDAPKRPPRLPKRLSVSLFGPPMENPGFSESGLPVQTVPMTPRTVASSIPMPKTSFIVVTTSRNCASRKPLFLANPGASDIRL